MTTSTVNPVTPPVTPPPGADAAANATLVDQFARNSAQQMLLAELNLQLGQTTAIANAMEAMGQAVKNRAEASKQLV